MDGTTGSLRQRHGEFVENASNRQNFIRQQEELKKLLGLDSLPTRSDQKSVPSSTENRPSSLEYTEAVSQWLNQYRMHASMWSSTYQLNPFYMMPFSPFTPVPGQNGQPVMQNGFIPSQTSQNSTPLPPQTPGRTGSPPSQQQQRQEATQTAPILEGKEYQIPSVYRRVTAEFIDFIILFSIKILLTLFVMEYTDTIGDQTDFTMKFLLEELDEEATMEDLQQMLIMALLYRLGVCIYETFFLRRGVRYFGGATPGKRLLGLRVITSDRVLDLGNNKVLVFSGEDIGTWNALIRSLVKNFSMAFFFPVYLTILFYQHNRGAYDIIAGTMVVTGPRYRRYGAQNIQR
ncbi:uncharacterized protein LOC144444661 [Glandiceps talaboti]